MARMRIAAQMYTIREFCKTPADTARSLEKLAKIGYSAVQVSGVGPIEPRELRKLLDANGLVCPVTHTSWQRLQEDLQGLIEELKTLGATSTAVGYMPGEFHNRDGAVRFAQGLEKAGATMRAQGILLGYHNHSFEFEKYDGELCWNLIFQNTTRQNVFAEIDTYWVQHGGADPAYWIGQFAGHIPVVHFKDLGVLQEKQVMLEVGEGNLNWPRILEACEKAGVAWAAVEQDNCNGRDPFESLGISLRNLKKWGYA